MKTTTQKRTRQVPKTIGGTTHLIDQKYTEDVPELPPDLDGIALAGVISAVSAILLGAIIWSTISIGSLLSAVAPPWAAYMVAVAFDLSWIICLVLDWLSRFDKKRARLPRTAGWIALAVSMVLIALHGSLAGSVVVGIAGAVVSAIAKGLWTVVMNHMSVEMDQDTAAWVDKDRQKKNAMMAVLSAQGQLDKMESRVRYAASVRALRTADRTETWDVTDGRTEGTVRPVVSSADIVRPSAVRPVVSVRLSKSGRVRDMVASGMDNQAIKEAVRDEFGPDTNMESIGRLITRARTA
jgi:hypothetical protein